MKKFTAFILACIAALSLVAAGCRDNDTPESPETQDKNVTIRIEGDGGCFRKISFTVEKGTVLNAAAYENVMRINNGGKTVYFLGEWHTEEGEKFDFSAPVNESVTISPEKTQVYFEEDNYPYIVMSANEALKENPAMKTVVLPIKSPVSGNSMTNGTLLGGDSEDSIFNAFNYIETAVIPEEIHTVSGALFLNCTALKEVYFPGYGYYMNRTVTPNFLSGCTALEHIYFADEEALEDFRTMLDDAVENAREENADTANLERLKPLLAVKTAPYMYWDADDKASG